MKIFITLITILLSTTNVLSQNITRSELSMEEISYLEKDLYKGFSEISNETMEEAVKNNHTNYDFEIEYKDSVIYRGVINKPSLTDVGKGMYRTSARFCLEYNTFDTETKLELSENKKLNLITTKNGEKYYCSYDYRLFELKYRKDLIVNDNLSKDVKIKFYKIQYD